MAPDEDERHQAAGALADGVARVRAAAEAVRANVERVIVGKAEVIDLLLVALLSEGHALIEDVPGTGKTVLAKALARSLGIEFARIQGTPDLLPSDVTGTSYFNQKLGEFEFRPGPIFANVVLADEINRATPRTQASLLEAMQERQVTTERQTLPLPLPFMLVATQNPIELEGTFPLPEAQLDRFMLRLRMRYPSFDEERAILYRFQETQPLDALRPVVSGEALLGLLPTVRAVAVSRIVADYLLGIVRGTRDHPAVELGASPRAALALFRGSQARAALRGRVFVQPDDVKALAVPVLAHRLLVTAQGRLRGQDVEQVIADVVAATPVPVERLGDEEQGNAGTR
ncbi:MAG TPA: MoxR family ATPase [Ktedonobacterales bacterium]|jgi:MoxR-like ATPase